MSSDPFAGALGSRRGQTEAELGKLLTAACSALRAGDPLPALSLLVGSRPEDRRLSPAREALCHWYAERAQDWCARMDAALVDVGLARYDDRGELIAVATSFIIRDAQRFSYRRLASVREGEDPERLAEELARIVIDAVCIRAGGLVRAAGPHHLRRALGERLWQRARKAVALSRGIDSRTQRPTQLLMNALPSTAMWSLLDESGLPGLVEALVERACKPNPRSGLPGSVSMARAVLAGS